MHSRHFQRLTKHIPYHVTACASIVYVHLYPGNYDTHYSTSIDKQLKDLDAKCPQGDEGLLLQRNLLFKSRYDAYGDQQSLFLAKSDESIVGVAAAMSTQYIIDEHQQTQYRETYLLDMRVDPNHRRKGIGSTITKLRYEWAKYDQHANIASFCLLSTNSAPTLLHQKHVKEENDGCCFSHNMYVYAMKENENREEVEAPLCITTNNYNICVQAIEDVECQKAFLNENVPKHYILYPNEESLDILVNSTPFNGVYVARLRDENDEYVNDEWVSISVYDQSKILYYLLNETVLKPVLLAAEMSTVKDKKTEIYIIQQLLDTIRQDYEDKMLVMIPAEEFDEVYGHFFEKISEAHDYYVNLDEDDEIYTKIQVAIHNAGDKKIWMDPRKR